MISLALSYLAVPDSTTSQQPHPAGEACDMGSLDATVEAEAAVEEDTAMTAAADDANAQDGFKDLVATFVDITGVDAETALHLLEVSECRHSIEYSWLHLSTLFIYAPGVWMGP